MGKTAPHTAAVQAFADSAPYPCRVLVGANNMAELMAEADLAIGAAGSTSWERCCLGLPTLQIIAADNQKSAAYLLEQYCAARILWVDRDLSEQLTVFFNEIYNQPIILHDLSIAAAKLVDGLGVGRVILNL